MAINKKLIYFKHKSNFTTALNDKQILDTSIVWIEDTKEIYTHGQYFGFPADRDSDLTTVETLANQLSQELNTEKAVRAEADSDLNGKITAEITDRTNADQNMQELVDANKVSINTHERNFRHLDNKYTSPEDMFSKLGASTGVSKRPAPGGIVEANIGDEWQTWQYIYQPSEEVSQASRIAPAAPDSNVSNPDNWIQLATTADIDALVAEELAAEITNRTNADTVLDNRITALEKLQYDFGTISLYLSKNSSNEAMLSPGDVISQEDYDKLIGLHDKTNNTIITGKITVNCDDPIILVDIPVTVTWEHTTFIDKLKLSGVFYNYDVLQDLLCQDCIKMTVQLNHNPMTGAIVKQITLNYFKELCFRTAEIQTIFNPTTS